MFELPPPSFVVIQDPGRGNTKKRQEKRQVCGLDCWMKETLET